MKGRGAAKIPAMHKPWRPAPSPGIFERRLPPSVIDEASKDALTRFINDFPHPKRRLEIDQTFDTPLRLGDPKAILAAGTSTWFQGSRLKARYDPSASRYGPPIPKP